MKEAKKNLLLYGSSLLLLCILVFIKTTHAARPGADRHDDVIATSAIIERKLVELNDIHVLPQEGLKEKDRIIELPGQPNKVSFGQYGGYVTVNKDAGRAFYYYFVEADGLTNAPLLLWLNGGPGCSSLGYGAMTELGPFRVKSNGKDLYENIYAWNKVANVLFLESPVSVGFSYSNTSSDAETNGDERTATDNYIFLLNWLERFPEYKKRDLYLTGESYAGHYVPQLADQILKHNNLPNNKNNSINLKGIAIGNPSLDIKIDALGQYKYLLMHAFITEDDIEIVEKICDFSLHENEWSNECRFTHGQTLDQIKEIDMYNVYASKCKSEGVTHDQHNNDFSIMNFDPCSKNYVTYYLNLPEVQLALHANVTKIPYPWSMCSVIIKNETPYRAWVSRKWTDAAKTTIPLLQNLLSNSIPILVYNGDFDYIKSYAGTKEALKKLNLTEKVPSTPWNVSNEVGGYSVVYKGNLTYTTVRGAGHEVPSYQPERALTMIKSFLHGKQFPQFVDKQAYLPAN